MNKKLMLPIMLVLFILVSVGFAGCLNQTKTVNRVESDYRPDDVYSVSTQSNSEDDNFDADDATFDVEGEVELDYLMNAPTAKIVIEPTPEGGFTDIEF